MMIFRLLYLLGFLILCGGAQAADFRVAFINPGGTSGFWGEVVRTMSAAARDFDVDLEILNADHKPYAMEKLLQQRLDQGHLPDYFILVNEEQAGARMMQQLAGTSSKVLFMLNKLTTQQRAVLQGRNIDMGKIIASIEPDNEIAGYEMAQSLIDRARELQPDRDEIKLLALTGDGTSPTGHSLKMGMLRAVADNQDVKLIHAIPVEWNEQKAYMRSKHILRGGRVDAVWSASDEIARGALRAASDDGLTPGKDILFSGLGWSQRGMQAVKDQEMTMTYGGHYFAGAWAIVMLRDHLHDSFEGEMFVDLLFEMSPITSENVDMYLECLGDGNWDRIDFTSFSRTGQKGNHYDFSAAAILNAAGKCNA